MPIALTWGGSLKAQPWPKQANLLGYTVLWFPPAPYRSELRKISPTLSSQSGNDGCFLLCFWYWQGRRGISPCPAEKLDLVCWSQICIFPLELSLRWLLAWHSSGCSWEWDQCPNSDLSWTGIIRKHCVLSLGYWQLPLLWFQRFPWEPFLFYLTPI